MIETLLKLGMLLVLILTIKMMFATINHLEKKNIVYVPIHAQCYKPPEEYLFPLAPVVNPLLEVPASSSVFQRL